MSVTMAGRGAELRDSALAAIAAIVSCGSDDEAWWRGRRRGGRERRGDAA